MVFSEVGRGGAEIVKGALAGGTGFVHVEDGLLEGLKNKHQKT